MAGVRGRLTATGVAFSSSVRLRTIILTSGAGAASSCELRNNSAGSGDPDLTIRAPAADSTLVKIQSDWDAVHVTIAGAGAEVYLESD